MTGTTARPQHPPLLIGAAIILMLQSPSANAVTYKDAVGCWETYTATGALSICLNEQQQVSLASRTAYASCSYPRSRVQALRDKLVVEIPAGPASCTTSDGKTLASRATRFECAVTSTNSPKLDCYGSPEFQVSYSRAFWPSLEDMWQSHPYKDVLIGRQHMNEGRWDWAERQFKTLIEIAKREQQFDTLGTALVDLGYVYQALGRYAEAGLAYRESHSVREQHQKDNGFAVGIPLHHLAMLYSRQGDVAAAESLFEQSRSIWEQALEQNAIYVAGSLTAQGKMYLTRRDDEKYVPKERLDKAEPLLRRALIIAGSYPDHNILAVARRNVGELMTHRAGLAPRCQPSFFGETCRPLFDLRAKYEAANEAERLLLEAVSLQEKLRGANSLDVGQSLLILAELYRNRAREADADQLWHRIRAIPNMRLVTVAFATNRTFAGDPPTYYVETGLEAKQASTFGSARKLQYSDEVASDLDFGHAVMIPMHEQAAYRDIRRGAGSLDLSEGQLSRPDRFKLHEWSRLFPESKDAGSVVVFIPGYNTSFESALRQATKIAFDLDEELIYLFSWPSQGRFGYFSARWNVAEAAHQLIEFLATIGERMPQKKIHLIAHSMGGQVVLRAISEIRPQNLNVVSLGEIVLAHPDVDSNQVATAAATVRELGSNMTIYASRDDWALRLSRWINFSVRAGGQAVVYDGVDTIDVTGLGTEFWALNHDAYVANPVLFGDMARLFKGIRPANERTSYFERAVTDQGVHWRYRQAGAEPPVGSGSGTRAPVPLTVTEGSALKPKDSFTECKACPEMVVVSAGSFMMGSPDSEERWKDYDGREGPLHQVTIKSPFAVGRFAVTFDEWDACVAGGGCNDYRAIDYGGWGRGRRPVGGVSWHDAKAYVAWLTKTTGKHYRLLSEAEREYVTRAGTTTPFWWGSSISTSQANYHGDGTYAGGPKGEKRQKTVPVDSFAPNPWGLSQVHGNIDEWVEDCWHDNYQGAPTDGSAWTTGDCNRRVLRGGAWDLDPQTLRSAARNWVYPADRDRRIGFRVARTL